MTVNVLEMIKFGVSDFNKVMLIVRFILLLAQIIFEFVKAFVERYIKLFMYSISRDLQPFTKFKQVKGNFFEAIDAPLEAIAGTIHEQQEEVDEIKQEVENLYEQYDKKTQIKIRQQSHENAVKQKKEIVEHLNIITNKLFGKNKKTS